MLYFDNPCITVCPHCSRATNYAPNPYYFHICEHCGRKSTQSELITALDPEKLKKIEEKIEEKIEKIQKLKNLYPVLKNGQLIKNA